jgi:hypothetical protein
MLCQLVCVDRRYQRMNCFNIRELQGILKRKFFTDLINTTDSHQATDSTLINMRHKNNMSNILLYDQSLLYNFDITKTSKFKNFTFTPGKVYSYSTNTNFLSYNALTVPNYISYIVLRLFNTYYALTSLLQDVLTFFSAPTLISTISIPTSVNFLLSSINSNVYFVLPNFTYSVIFNSYKNINIPTDIYNSSVTNYKLFNSSMPYSFSENSSS